MLKEWIDKYRNQIVYLIFGVLTTIVDFVVYELIFLSGILPLSIRATGSNVIAWVAAVLFAFVTNKPFVFNSKDWSGKIVIPEFLKFISARLISLLVSTLIIFVFVDVLCFNNLLIKALASVFVIIFNYFASKFFVFTRKQ